MMRRSLVITMLSFLTGYLRAQLPVYGADSLMKHYTAKANDLMVADTSLRNCFSIDIYGINMYASPDAKSANQPEMKVTWSELPVYKRMMKNESPQNSLEIMLEKGAHNFSPAVQKQYSADVAVKRDRFHPPHQPLYGLRIALDPGHVANDTALGRIEQKFIVMKTPAGINSRDSLPVAFAEGQLTWQTAALIAARLKNLGAEVMITRQGPGMTAFGKTFEQWKRDDYRRTLDSLLVIDPQNQNLQDIRSGKLKGDRAIFRFVFRDAELRKRAERINEFHPDLTVVIHYNVDETNAPWNHPSGKNFSMLFVPGAFQKDELKTPEDRYEFLRLLLLDDVENSTNASGIFAAQFLNLNVPLAKTSDAGYLVSSCRQTSKLGVYARNLSMTRLVHGTIVYGETLYQDNITESLALDRMNYTDSISGQRTSKRVLSVAEAYCAGISQWYYTR